MAPASHGAYYLYGNGFPVGAARATMMWLRRAVLDHADVPAPSGVCRRVYISARLAALSPLTPHWGGADGPEATGGWFKVPSGVPRTIRPSRLTGTFVPQPPSCLISGSVPCLRPTRGADYTRRFSEASDLLILCRLPCAMDETLGPFR